MEKEHVINVLKKVQFSLNSENYPKINELSNWVIHSASIEQDPDIISLAVIIYSLSKLIERKNYKSYDDWTNFYKTYIKEIENMINKLEKNDIDGFRKGIKKIRKQIQRLSGNLKLFIQDVFHKASINKASRIYEHGISMEKTAKILGISMWELAEYAGQSRIIDVDLSVTMPIKERIKIAEDIFSG